MEYPHFVTYALDLSWQVKYLVIFIGMLIEGPLVIVACGFFLRFGVFDFAPLYSILVIGDLVADVGWYYIGYYFAEPLVRKFGKFLGVTPEIFEKVKKLLHDHPIKILLGSKITMGFGLALATVITAGAVKVPFKKYLILNAIGETLFVSILLAVGYFFGHFYTIIGKGFADLFLILTAIVVIFAIFGFAKYMKTRTLSKM